MCLEETWSVIGVAAGLAGNIVTGLVEGTVMTVGVMSGVGFVGKIEMSEHELPVGPNEAMGIIVNEGPREQSGPNASRPRHIKATSIWMKDYGISF